MFTKPRKILFNDGWKFLSREFNSPFPELEEGESKSQEWRDVELPHDRLVWGNRSSQTSCDSWYKKTFPLSEIEAESVKNNELLLELTFDGVHPDCLVYVNSVLAFDCSYGAVGFAVDISQHVKEGENIVHVGVRIDPSKNRTHTGGGIYRNVWLTKHNNSHILNDGVYVITRFEGSWKVRVQTEYAGEADAVRYSIYKPSGELLESVDASGDYIFSFENKQIEVWDFDNPKIYKLKAQLIKEDRIVDEACTTFGFRTLSLSLDGGGLKLNRRKIELTRLRGVKIYDIPQREGSYKNLTF